ncbi:MAG: phosphodiester glycosidase family protein [Bacillota bacterium]
MRRLALFLLTTLAPFLGIAIGFAFMEDLEISLNTKALAVETQPLSQSFETIQRDMKSIKAGMGILQLSLEEQEKQYKEQQRLLQELIAKSQEQKELTEEVYEKLIVSRLGELLYTWENDRTNIMVFFIQGAGYKGYAAKVKIFDPTSIKVVLANDTFGEAETTLDAARRNNAVLAVNGGGFYFTSSGGSRQVVPLGNTVIAGNLVNEFIPSYEDIYFAGLDKDGLLVGDLVEDEKELWDLNPMYGVSFVPILIKDRMPLDIPSKWKKERHPRTIIGQYANGDLLFLVIDGRRQGWSNGITLEQAQVKLMQLGVVEAYNLDGGGSSTIAYDGEILNKPSDGYPRPVATNIVVLP